MRIGIVLALVALLATAASGQYYLEFGGDPIRDPIPPDGSPWHELFPSFCTMHTQTGYGDNGDGVVSECDAIYIDGQMFHIIWVGPTYHMSNSAGEPGFFEPTDPEPGGNPICETWHEVAPDFCLEWHIDDWEDNGDGVVSQCDIVWIAGEPWHIDEIRLNITVVPGSPVEDSTWGKIKAWLGGLFE